LHKREFLKLLGLGGAGLVAGRLAPAGDFLLGGNGGGDTAFWTWIARDPYSPADVWKERFAVMREAGIQAVLPEIYDGRKAYFGSSHLPVIGEVLETILPLAKAEGLEVHAWMWSMPCNIEDIWKQHPEWYVVNRKGESAADKPAYVPYYRFLCPSRPEVHEFVRRTVEELSSYESLDGIHLDYIRYPDVILPRALQPKYGITQDREYPEYDYCYCSLCCEEFEKETGIRVLELEDPSTSREWKQFRYDRITRLVNDTLIPVARAQKKKVTAAVFPNWEMVRQYWPAWNLDAALPMLYSRMYGEDAAWIREQTEKGVRALNGRAPLYSGLMVGSPEELREAIVAATEGGAGGVALFHARALTDAHWEVVRAAARS
jgi:uncharacterized lipoprotein YddW (UPF0748 family)